MSDNGNINYEELNKLYADAQKSFNDYISIVATSLGIDEANAAQICYLRTRSRWNKELEDRAVSEIKRGFNISMHYPPRMVSQGIYVEADEAFCGDIPPEYLDE